MEELPAQQPENNLEQDPKTKPLARSLAGAAFVLVGVWTGKKLAPHAKAKTLDLLDRLDITEHRRHPYLVYSFKSLAESFGIEVREEHLEYWQNMLTIARSIDDIIDEDQPTSLSAEISKLLNGTPLKGMSQEETDKFLSIIVNASDERHDIVMQGLDVKEITGKVQMSSSPNEVMNLREEEGKILAQSINDISEKIRITRNPQEMLELRRQEGEFLGRIMTMENPNNDPLITAFNKCIIELCINGYLFDSLVDLRDDFKNGITAVAPTSGNYLAISKEVMNSSLNSLAHLSTRNISGLTLASLRHVIREIYHVKDPL